MKNKVCYLKKDRDLLSLRNLSHIMDFDIGLEISVCNNAMLNAYALLMDNPDIFKRKTKMWGKTAMKHMTDHLNTIRSEMVNKKFWDDYIESVIDIADADVEKFRKTLYDVIAATGHKDALLYSYVEVAGALLRMASDHWDIAIRQAFTLDGYWYKKTFKEFCMADVRDAWGNMCELVYNVDEETELNTDETKAAFNIIYENFITHSYSARCENIAKEGHESYTHNITLRD